MHFVKLSHQHPSTSEVCFSVVRDEGVHLREERGICCIVNLIEDGAIERYINVTPEWCQEVCRRDEGEIRREERRYVMGEWLLERDHSIGADLLVIHMQDLSHK